MRRFVFANLFESSRSLLALVIALPAIGGALYLGVHPLGRSPGPCRGWDLVLYCSSHPTRLAWQFPVAVVVGAVGLVPAAVIATWRRTRRRPQPELSSPLPSR